MAVKIKLKRMGKIRAPHYRIVVADARTKRDGRAIEEIGKYHPKEDPSFIEVDSERVQYWLKVGAQPTEPVKAILEVTGDWQRFKGLPEPKPMRTAAPKADKKAVFEAAAKEAAGDPKEGATTARAKSRRSEKTDKAAEKPAESKAAESKPAESKAAESKAAEPKPAESKAAESKPAEPKPAEPKPADPEAAEAKPAESKPAEPAAEATAKDEA